MNRFLRSQRIGLFHVLRLFLFLPLTSFAASYFVTPSGGGNHSGTSSGNPWSLGDFNGSGQPTGGDTVTFSGTFTSTVTPAKGGTGNGSGRLTLNMTGATLTGAAVGIQINNLAYLTVNGGTFGSSYNGTLINFKASNGQSHDVTLNGWTFTGPANGVATFVSLNHCSNTVISNCYADNVSMLVYGDSTLNHDTDITGCFARTSTDTSSQDDLIHLGDAPNITIEKCKLISRAPANPAFQHNDIVQTYTKGGSNPGSPTNWVIRYNWFEMQQVSGSGDCSFLMLQSMGGNPALKVYGNVFYGSGSVGSNGVCVGRNNGGSYYFYNNTVIRHNNPDNCIRFADSGTVYAENNVGMADPSVGKYTTFVLWTMGLGASDYNFYYLVYTPGGGPVASFYAGPHGSVNTNPLFTNFNGQDFSLSASSPLRGKGDRNIGSEFNQGIKAGSSWPNPTLTTRNTWDVGAFNQ